MSEHTCINTGTTTDGSPPPPCPACHTAVGVRRTYGGFTVVELRDFQKKRSDRFPIMDGPSIPWAMIEPWERRALANHDQTLQRLSERGGLSCLEAMCVLEDRKPPRGEPESAADAKQKLAAALAAYDADGLRARIATLEAALRGAKRMPSHYEHHDPKGTAGANCPACIATAERREAIDAALAQPVGGKT